MKLLSPIPHKKARIEVIPLIDIMFFLLAVMMMVSLSMVQMKGLKINLPTAANATPENRSDFITISVKQDGTIYVERVPVDRTQLVNKLKGLKAAKPNLRIYIQGDVSAIHGDIMAVLDRVRAAGIQKVAFQIRPDDNAGGIIADKAPIDPAPDVAAPAPAAASAPAVAPAAATAPAAPAPAATTAPSNVPAPANP